MSQRSQRNRRDKEAAAIAAAEGISYIAALRQVRQERDAARVEFDAVMRTVGGATFPEHLARQMVQWCEPDAASHNVRTLSFRDTASEAEPPYSATVRDAVLSADGTEMVLVLALNPAAARYLPGQRPVELRLAASSLADLVQAHQAEGGRRAV